ncbi:hypothetical protein FZO89_13245 [Luteimonas viscosa]|uniref:Repeat domain-containing protein n=1 Tax=Luteimonas viscosa TaxID=1132694 RepID=A0A5D4XR28_9GAMM|nr:FG-GAP-like repeat-containing protein [Luteimonas viscosa]TYT27147.1 hypothetical protein FZO89_13245 [Luteimonas viscosa]
MRKHLLGLMLVAGLAGCTSESDSDPAAAAVPKTADSPASGSLPTGESLAALRGSPTSFASLPDRGELLSYGGARKSRQSGAYTYHPVALSEAHALNAIGSGELVLATPDGEPVKIKYERHEEQPDGNWTWIGRNADGSSAILTFGEKAVFGMISRGDDYYRVRTDRTGAWVVETDRSLLASSGGRREKGEDFLLPPEAGALTAAAARHLSKASPSVAANVSTKAAAMVDVLVGYSSGLASVYGSQSAAATFVTSLVALTNSAYANSGVNMRLRAVHTLQVNYADNSDNQEALQQLTGYNADTQQPITPNSAFNALREAREEYGADLVAFVRRYREPEQDGCGIAWLLGMNGSGISAANDAAFGYAVVSDGEDRDESDNNTYFCSDFSLAHELGHLMGQAHNEEDAADAGAHEYSYGYREASATGFHTIMAYPSGASQIEAPHFANPSVKYVNRPTGTAMEDNARSMNQTMPVIANFRATVVPLSDVRSDIDGDGKADIIFRHTGNGKNVIWKSANRATQEAMVTTTDQAWTIVGTGDINGDGKADVVWRNTVTGQNLVWPGGKRQQQQNLVGVTDQNWKIVGIGDFNGDGIDDLLWRNYSTGANAIWPSGQRAQQQAVDGVTNTNWKVVGVGDFDSDGREDILWREAVTGLNVIWRAGRQNSQMSVTGVTDTNWAVVGVGDFDGNGVDDILWRNASTGANVIWKSGDRGQQQAVAAVNRNWFVAAVGDFNGDGRADIFWRNSVNGENVYWRSGERSTQQWVAPVEDLSWKVFY